MHDDAQLLRRYSQNCSEEAFAEFVRHHLDFVFGVALRQVGGNVHLAGDVTQYVFIEVARKAGPLAKRSALKGWLYSTARNAAANIVRAERRRQAREHTAYTMNEINDTAANPDSHDLLPVMDHALGSLRENDREVVLLRFFEGCDYAEIGARCCITADAARLRVERALEKMRTTLARRGMGSTITALTGALTAQAAIVAPAGLIGSVVSTALADITTTASGSTILTLITMTKQQLGIICAVIAAGGAAVLFQGSRQVDPPRRVVNLSSGLPRQTLPPASAPLATVPALSASSVPVRDSAVFQPPSAFRGRGRTTPQDAAATLFWNTWALDYPALAKMITFAEGDRQKVEAVYARIPERVRTTMKIGTPEDLFALAWSLENSERYERVLVGESQTTNPDEATVKFKAASPDQDRIGSGTMQFRRDADGWQWLVPSAALEHLETEVKRSAAKLGERAPGWAKEFAAEIAAHKP